MKPKREEPVFEEEILEQEFEQEKGKISEELEDKTH